MAGKLDWPQFAARIAEVVGVPVGRVEHGSSLLDDLGLDSLALTEVIVLLLVDLDMSSLEPGLAERDWRQVTVGNLFEEYSHETPAQPRTQFVMRTRHPR